jgi:hypothetical protein
VTDIEGEAREVGLSTIGTFGGALSLATMSDAEFTERVRLLRLAGDRMLKIQKDVMRAGTDYGNVPGVDKPSLAQPGAETLCNLFGLVPELVVTLTRGDGDTTPFLYYEARCLIHAGSVEGPTVGTGVGVCHSWETKYRYRKAERVCPVCQLPAIIKGREEYGGGWVCYKKKGGCGAKFDDDDPSITEQEVGMIENPDPWDIANTLVKMAAKRAHVDATKRTTGASAIFTQDLEEQGALPDEPKPAPAGTKVTAAPVVSEADAASLMGTVDTRLNTSERSQEPPAPTSSGSAAAVPMTLTEIQRRAMGTVGLPAVNAKSRELFQTTVNHLSDEQRQQVAEAVGLA